MKKQTTTKDIVRFYWRITVKYPRYFGWTFLNTFQTTANAVLTPLMAGFTIQKLQDPSSISLTFFEIFGLIIAWSLVGIVCHRIAMTNLNKLDINAMKDIYRIIARHLMSESYSFHARSFSGALLNQSTRLAQGYITFMDTLALDALRNAVIVVVSVVALSFYDLKLASLVFLMSAIGIGTAMYMARKRYPLRKEAVRAGTKQTAFLADMITNALTVKSFAGEEQEVRDFDAYLNSTGRKMEKSWLLGINANNITTALAIMMNLVVLAYGIYATNHGMLEIGVFIAAQLYAVRITGSFWDLTRIIRTLETVFADAHEMTQILQEKPTVLDQPGAKDIVVQSGAITFKEVTFRYEDDNESEDIFTDLNLEISPGEKVGLIGLSGGGKTTITKLLLRFMDIQKGSIEIDGQSIADVTQASLRGQIAYVPQEPLLFHRSLLDNIRYGKPTANEQEVVRAAKLAHADEFINQLPQGYVTQVGERGVKLSGGQRQRVAIARAMLKNAPILILDEATSALDSESEKLIQSALTEVMKGRTAIVVAHRLSTIQKMDRILVMDQGKIVEEGTHKELLRQDGMYAKLWNHQSGGFLEDDSAEEQQEEYEQK